MKILVTGGAGYIGSHTVVQLQKAGYETIIVDNFANSNPSVIASIEEITKTKPLSINLDLSDSVETEKFFQSNSDIKAIIHFAAHKAVR